MIRAYLDTNIFLIYLEEEISNSEIVINTAEDSLFLPVVSFHTFKEVTHNLKSRRSKDLASWMQIFIWSIQGLTVIQKKEIDQLIDKYIDLVDDKDDLPHICSYFAGNCDYFVTANRRLTQMKIKSKVNFVSPKKFIEKLNLKSIDTKNDI
ncbi:MAG: PIN domain-containing protein [Candidatus Thorarchaeota archaeon]